MHARLNVQLLRDQQILKPWLDRAHLIYWCTYEYIGIKQG